MTTPFQNKPLIGKGIYTLPDIAMILGIKYSKVNRWIKTFWDDRFGQNYGETYSWNVDLTRAVNFYTLVELNIFYQLNLAGVSSREILKAHEILSQQFDSPYPFALKKVISHLRSDGKKIHFEQEDNSIYTLDSTKQFNLAIIKDFFKNLDFTSDSLASRLWPIGKDKSIVCDPHHQFGQPVVNGTNILAEVIADMIKSGDSRKFIAKTYNLKVSQINDALEYARKAA